MEHLDIIAKALTDEGYEELANEVLSGNHYDEICKRLIDAFTNFKDLDNQKRLVAQIGYSKDYRFFDFLEHCIFNATDEDIRHGTLKYLSYYRRDKNLLYIFEKIEDLGLRQTYEPYFSMSVNMIGGECKTKFGVS
jgi:hypothetical protein